MYRRYFANPLPFIGGFRYSGDQVLTFKVTVLHQSVTCYHNDVGTNISPMSGVFLFTPDPASKYKMKTIMPCPLASDETRRGSPLPLVRFSPWLGNI